MMESPIERSRQRSLYSRNLYTKCLAPYGPWHMTSNQQRGRCHLCSQFIKAATNLRHTVVYIWAVRWLYLLREFWFLGWPNLQKPTAQCHTNRKRTWNSIWPTDPRCNILSALYHTIQHKTERPPNICRQKGLPTYVLWLLDRLPKHPPRKTLLTIVQRKHCSENVEASQGKISSSQGSCRTPTDPKTQQRWHSVWDTRGQQIKPYYVRKFCGWPYTWTQGTISFNANITHNGGHRWIGRLYVDDLCLISSDAHELQVIINTCQTWSEKPRMQLNAKKKQW